MDGGETTLAAAWATAATLVAGYLAWRRLASSADVCDPIRDEWECVSKTPGGRVNRESFKVRARSHTSARRLPHLRIALRRSTASQSMPPSSRRVRSSSTTSFSTGSSTRGPASC